MGPFEVSFVALSHSIPEGNGLLIETPFGNVFHTGDWKIDETPVIGEAPSTRDADRDWRSKACSLWSAIRPTSSRISRRGRKRASTPGLLAQGDGGEGPRTGHDLRLQCGAAPDDRPGRGRNRTGSCIAGRSLDRILRVAQATGYLQDFPPPISFEEAMRLPQSEVLIIATGGQGEPRAALGRIASGTHELKLAEGDTVIFSSRIIPGNEVAIGRIMNQLSDLGARIVTERQAHVHVSGHPGRPELIQMYRWVRPESSFRCMARTGILPSMRVSRWQRRPAGDRPEERRRDPPRSRGTRERSTKSASAGWCSTATSSFPPTARR